jgi:hypothetical protein
MRVLAKSADFYIAASLVGNGCSFKMLTPTFSPHLAFARIVLWPGKGRVEKVDVGDLLSQGAG